MKSILNNAKIVFFKINEMDAADNVASHIEGLAKVWEDFHRQIED